MFVACVASVSVGFSARHVLLFGGTKIGASATLMEGAERGRGGEKRPPLPLPAPSISVALAPIFVPPKSKKWLAEKPTETLATQATNLRKA